MSIQQHQELGGFLSANCEYASQQIHKVTWIGAVLLLINIIVFALPNTT